MIEGDEQPDTAEIHGMFTEFEGPNRSAVQEVGGLRIKNSGGRERPATAPISSPKAEGSLHAGVPSPTDWMDALVLRVPIP